MLNISEHMKLCLNVIALYPELKPGIVVMTNNLDLDPMRVVGGIYFRATRK